jgi:pimeloyl-ACP methyl ester carboxylesterase
MSGNQRQWDRVIALLLPHGIPIGYAAPVMRHRDFGDRRPTVAEYGATLAAQLEHDSLEHVVLVSHSVGAFPAFATARSAPGRVVELVVVNGGLSSVGRFIDSPLRALVSNPRACLTYLRLFLLVGVPVPQRVKRKIASQRWSTRAVVGKLVSEAAIATDEQRESLILQAGKVETVIGLWENRHHWPEFEQSASSIYAHVRLIVGDQDPMTTVADTEVMADLLPDATIEVLVGIGHAAPLEAAADVVAAIESALADLTPA